MPKILSNRWAVAALVVCAIAVLYLRVIVPVLQFTSVEIEAPILDEDDIDSVLEENAAGFRDNADQKLQFVSAQYDLKQIAVKDLRWNESPRRDPFAPHAELERDQIKAVHDKVTPGMNGSGVRSVGLPIVSAILNSRKEQLAVIDGQILQIGEHINGFELRAIARSHVSLLQLSSNRSHLVAVKK